MHSLRIVISLALVSYSAAHTIVPYVDPQPGENLWGLVSREGTAIDYIIDQDIAITATVDNTFLLLQDINLDFGAITSTLARIVTDLGVITTTLNNTYQEVVNCCPCTYFISQADVPITVTAPGTYCVTEDVSASSLVNATITISGTDITIDLQGHTVYAATVAAIRVAGPTARIRIKNGTVTGPTLVTGRGVILDAIGSNVDVVIENIVANGCYRGFSFSGHYREIQALHCMAKNCTEAGFRCAPNTSGLNPTVVYDHCVALNNLDGFLLFPNNNDNFSCTLTNCRSEANTQIGYSVTPNVPGVRPNVSMYNCTALRNGQCGFFLKSVNGVILRCVAESNGAAGLALTDPAVGAGFYLPDTTATDVTLIGCLAINNSYSGFTDRNATATNPNRFFNNYAIRNRGASQVNYDLATGVSQSVVVTTTNLLANNNLSWWANMNGV